MLILGAGPAGNTAALESRDAGYAVRILKFISRAGGRNGTLRGLRQTCAKSFYEGGEYLYRRVQSGAALKQATRWYRGPDAAGCGISSH